MNPMNTPVSKSDRGEPYVGLSAHRRDWDELATSDALWTILSSPDKQHGRWDVDEFFETGRLEFERVMSRAELLGVARSRREVALDFGCGVGRVTRERWPPLRAGHRRRRLERDDRSRLAASTTASVASSSSITTGPTSPSSTTASVDLVYSYIVLQHLPTDAIIEGYVARVRPAIVRPGGLDRVPGSGHHPAPQSRPAASPCLRHPPACWASRRTTLRHRLASIRSGCGPSRSRGFERCSRQPAHSSSRSTLRSTTTVSPIGCIGSTRSSSPTTPS